MKFNNKTLLILSILFFGINAIGITQSVNFAETSLANLKKGSKETEKPYFVYLFEEDCMDCKRMEQLTFQHASVANLVNEQLLATKIELNSPDGKKLAKKNKISLAPAILFYDQKGKLLLQQESALSSDSMLKLMKVLYDLDANVASPVIITVQSEQVNNEEIITPAQLISTDSEQLKNLKVVSAQKSILKQPKKAFLIKPAAVPVLSEDIIIAAELNNLKSPAQLFNEKSITAEVQQPIAANEAEKPPVHVLSKEVKLNNVNAQLVNNTVIHKEIISVPEKKEPTPIVASPLSSKNSLATSQQDRLIQFGAYTKYDDVLKGMYKLKKKLETSLTIIEETTKGKVMYKLVSADQLTLQNAQKSVSEFKRNGIDCFVRRTN